MGYGLQCQQTVLCDQKIPPRESWIVSSQKWCLRCALLGWIGFCPVEIETKCILGGGPGMNKALRSEYTADISGTWETWSGKSTRSSGDKCGYKPGNLVWE